MEAREITINGLLHEVCGRAGGRRAGPSLVQQSYNAATKELETAFTQVNEMTQVFDNLGTEKPEDAPA